jgi:hypothetical protein
VLENLKLVFEENKARDTPVAVKFILCKKGNTPVQRARKAQRNRQQEKLEIG